MRRQENPTEERRKMLMAQHSKPKASKNEDVGRTTDLS
jgi:hypothetical protein